MKQGFTVVIRSDDNCRAVEKRWFQRIEDANSFYEQTIAAGGFVNRPRPAFFGEGPMWKDAD